MNYLNSLGAGGIYRLTVDGFQKIGFVENSNGPDALSSGPSVGDVAERVNAPDRHSGGAVPDKSAPVGSNPTVSVFSLDDLGPRPDYLASTPIPPWQGRK